MAKYSIYHGEFACHTCKEKVLSLRAYEETGDLTWMCSSKHISKVSLRKKGY